ncbi:MAG: hypothetical protein Alis3KO_41540 [Aliiglaciecola sp.]
MLIQHSDHFEQESSNISSAMHGASDEWDGSGDYFSKNAYVWLAF